MGPKVLFAYLLQQCPYSQKMAKLIEAKEQKQWVRRGSKAYHELKKKYGPTTTFPIVLQKGKYIGGYSEFIKLTLKP